MGEGVGAGGLGGGKSEEGLVIEGVGFDGGGSFFGGGESGGLFLLSSEQVLQQVLQPS